MSIVDVIIPIHGNGGYLNSTFESIEAQDYPGSIRVICVLDRVETRVLDTINGWSNRLNLKVIYSEGQGISKALNTGIHESSARYIFRIDDDDTMSFDRIRKQIEKMESVGSRLAILGSGIIKIDHDGNSLSHLFFPSKAKNIRSVLNYGNPFAHSSMCIRATSIQNRFEYRAFYEPAEDFDMWSRILDLWEGENLHECLTSYRIHSNQISKLNQLRQLIAREAVIESQKIRRIGGVELNDRYENIIEWFEDPIEGPSAKTKFRVKAEYFIRSKFSSPLLFNFFLALFSWFLIIINFGLGSLDY